MEQKAVISQDYISKNDSLIIPSVGEDVENQELSCAKITQPILRANWQYIIMSKMYIYFDPAILFWDTLF